MVVLVVVVVVAVLVVDITDNVGTSVDLNDTMHMQRS